INKLSMYRFAKNILKNDVDTEDVVSEAILKAYKNKSKLKEINSFKSWIMRIVVNECYDLIKRNNKFDLTNDVETLNLVHHDNYGISLREIVKQLNYEYSSVITLYYYEDMSIKEISEVLEIAEGTVKSRLNRAKEKLKVLLEHEEV
ncbi:MAG: RNA polymerase sigma factor, partial [Paraclostridium sp.]